MNFAKGRSWHREGLLSKGFPCLASKDGFTEGRKEKENLRRKSAQIEAMTPASPIVVPFEPHLLIC